MILKKLLFLMKTFPPKTFLTKAFWVVFLGWGPLLRNFLETKVSGGKKGLPQQLKVPWLSFRKRKHPFGTRKMRTPAYHLRLCLSKKPPTETPGALGGCGNPGGVTWSQRGQKTEPGDFSSSLTQTPTLTSTHSFNFTFAPSHTPSFSFQLFPQDPSGLAPQPPGGRQKAR